MNLTARMRGWIRQSRRKRAASKESVSLREFVYLDEVSVYSLIASRLGPVATEFTDTEAASLQDEMNSSVGGGVGFAKGEMRSRALDAHTSGSQVLRKSIVQTTFKELYELEQDAFAIRPISAETQPPIASQLDDLKAVAERDTDAGWMIDPELLARGQLYEAEVELETEAIFRVSAVLSAILGMTQDSPEVFGGTNHKELVQAESVNRILEKLLVGLVPVRGRLIEYEFVTVRGKEWLVHCRLLNQLSLDDTLQRRPVYVVGVAEQSLFWKDIRRVLFSGSPFRVLCRVAQDGIQESWTPIKLAHVLDAVAPDLGQQIEVAGHGALAVMSDAGRSDRGTERHTDCMREALLTYAKLLAQHHGKTLHSEHEDGIIEVAERHCRSNGTLSERRIAFGAVTTELQRCLGIDHDPILSAQYRAVALCDAGVHLNGRTLPAVASDESSAMVDASDQRFLDSEFVAMYW